ncbi:FecR family protein [Chitinophaga defluvii]|uniref:FecR domain-containing protein n=1 Tax=Chitinophaga defluvii TaxID=3163343 RepID=A0ABV2TBQ7_9BACT
MSSNPIRLKYLFEKYLQNTCNKKELEEFWQLMSQLSENDLISGEMMALWDKMPPAYQPSRKADKEKIYASIFERAAAQEINYKMLHQKTSRPLVRLWQAAAVLLICLALGWWQWGRQVSPPPQQVAVTEKKARVHQVISLPDGSTVILNNDSKLDFPPVFSGNSRDVYLTGEAYFEVRKQAHKPFIVHTGRFVTTVLGTRFNIKAQLDDPDFAVTVTNGKVRVSDDKKELGTLLENDQMVVSKASGQATQQVVNGREVIAWTRQDLFFKNITLEAAMMILSDHYNTKILFRNDALQHCRFTGTFFSNNGLEQVLNIITGVTDTEWKKENDTIWIEGKGCTGNE